MHTLDSLLADPHLVATGFLGWETHPTEGRVRALAPSSRWLGTPPASQCPAPRLGEHSAEVLRDAGFPDDEIAALAASGVLGTAN
jgi:crotonobetainyl-CoA:carnitine CoA-transferase CaiB-like acyl-CoA transferase